MTQDRFDELARRYFPAHPHLQGVAANMAREAHNEALEATIEGGWIGDNYIEDFRQALKVENKP